MKFAKVALFTLFSSAFAAAQEDVPIVDSDESIIDSSAEQQTYEEQKYINLNISYTVRERPYDSIYSFLEFNDGDLLTLDYEVLSNEIDNVTITGVQGSILTYPGGELAANISVGKIGPLELVNNATVNFNQHVNLRLEEGQYYLAPSVLVVKDDELMRVGTRPTLLSISPPPISAFNIQYISIQITIICLIAGVYYAYSNLANPVSKATRAKELKELKAAKKSKPAKADASWLPEVYQGKK